MKRRLDLALALVHEPRVLFLDEPTTGLDPQSRTALWEEVARLPREDGVTVFLTTQYLEEADVLADRVGIIDRRPHRRRGHARGAEGRDRAPDASRSCRPADDRPRDWPGARRASARRARSRAEQPSPCGSTTARPRSPTSSARSTPRASRSPTSSCTRRRLDDVFLAKTGRTLEGAAARRRTPEAARRERASRPTPPCGVSSRRLWTQVAVLARRSIIRTVRQPATVVPSIAVPAVPAGGERRRPGGGHRDPRLPDRLLPDVRPRACRSCRPGSSSPSAAPAPTSPRTSTPASSTACR